MQSQCTTKLWTASGGSMRWSRERAGAVWPCRHPYSKCVLRTSLIPHKRCLQSLDTCHYLVAYRNRQSGLQVKETLLPDGSLRPGSPSPSRLLTLRNFLYLFHVGVHSDQDKLVTVTSRNKYGFLSRAAVALRRPGKVSCKQNGALLRVRTPGKMPLPGHRHPD